jgi:hypothetical protein
MDDKYSSDLPRRALRGHPQANAMFCQTVSFSNNAEFCSTSTRLGIISRFAIGQTRMSSIRISPAEGDNTPARHANKVDLPEPDSPTNAVKQPFSTLSETPRPKTLTFDFE